MALVTKPSRSTSPSAIIGFEPRMFVFQDPAHGAVHTRSCNRRGARGGLGPRDADGSREKGVWVCQPANLGEPTAPRAAFSGLLREGAGGRTILPSLARPCIAFAWRLPKGSLCSLGERWAGDPVPGPLRTSRLGPGAAQGRHSHYNRAAAPLPHPETLARRPRWEEMKRI